jgi:cytochrome c551/c552
MKYVEFIGASLLVLAWTASGQDVVNKYCVACHNDKLKTGGFSVTSIDFAHPEQNAAQAEKVILKLRSGMMPPAGLPRPQRAVLDQFAASLENAIDAAALNHPDPGRPALHRLNRAEYANSVRDLLNLEVNAEDLLPADDMSHGFDNMAEVLTISPTLMDAYIRAAGKVARLAVGDPTMSPVVETYHLGQSYSQLRHVEGTPIGTRGGLAVTHVFPADGEYIFRTTLHFTNNTYLFGSTMKGEQLEISINGRRVGLFDINPMMKTEDDFRTPPIQVKAGPQLVSAAFIPKANGPIQDFVMPYERILGNNFQGQDPGLTSPPHVRDFGINGPYRISGVSETPSRAKIFVCRPNAKGDDELHCAKQIVTTLARQAYRQPPSDAAVEELMTAYQRGRNHGDFETGVRLAVQTVLAHPSFVLRFERTPENVAPGTNYRISDLELASRLSYFLWSSAPDSTLITLAAQNKLHESATLEAQVRRMLADPKSEALAKNFAGQWLYLRNLKDLQPDFYLFPDSDDNLFQSMRREVELFFLAFLHEKRSVADMLTADFTFLDERQAKHYGVPNVVGNNFRRVKLEDENRFGLLGKGAILSVTSYANRTSPVVRGKWILEQIMGVNVPVPPPNVPNLKDNAEGIVPKSVKERLQEHRTQEPCHSCHQIMDPIGLAMENFDAVGTWRTKDLGNSIEPVGKLYDGTEVNGVAGLRNALAARSDLFVRSLTVKLLEYALGRGLSASDMPVVRAIDRDAAKSNLQLSAIVQDIVKSVPFKMRRAEQALPESGSAAVAANHR